MTTVTLQGPSYYLSGVNVDINNSRVVGYESERNRVARYSFISPSSGASHIDLSFTGMTFGDGTKKPLRFYIGTSDTDHADAGAGSSYTGEMSYSSNTWSGSADIILQPTTVYYLWIFPSATTYGYWYWVNCTASMTCNGGLKTVISCSNGTLGSSNTLTLTRYSSTFTHKITATCGTASMIISSNAQSDTVSWTPPIDWASQNVSAVKVSVTVTCETYNGSTSVGSTSAKLTMSIPSNVVPSVSLSVSDANGYLSTYGGYIQKKSVAKVISTSAGVYGSSIKSCVITCGSLSSSSNSGTFELPTSGTITVKAAVTDSRGRKASASTTITVIEYAPPTSQITTAYRCDSNGTANYEGTYVYAVFNAEVTSLSSKNTASYAFKYRVRGETSWTSISLSTISGEYTPIGVSQIFAADTTKSYEMCISVTDAFGTVDSQYRTVSPTSPFLDISRASNAMGLGYRAKKTNALSVGLYTEFLAGTSLCNYGFNLLDNSYFPQAINQRGVTTTTAETYCLDRYIARISGITLSTDGDGLHMSSDATLNALIYQKLAQGTVLNGKTVTIAICDGSGNIACASTALPGTNATSWTSHTSVDSGNACAELVDVGDGSDYPLAVTVGIKSGSTTETVVKWVALYEGEYTVDTLPTYKPKSYAAELMECQRYCYILPAKCCLSGMVTSSNKQIYIDSMQQFYRMRVTPTVTLSGTIVVRTNSGYSTATGFTTSDGGDVSLLSAYTVNAGYNTISLTFADSVAVTNNSPVHVVFNGPIVCSADL